MNGHLDHAADQLSRATTSNADTDLEERPNGYCEATSCDESVSEEEGDDDRQLLVLYASQTGSAQDVAEYIGREAWRRHFRARVVDVKDFDATELLEAPPTIIVTSTTGQGSFPTSILPLWNNFLLRTDLPEDMLQDLSYCIFGLGDSSYPKFNWPARKLDRRLKQLGGHTIVERGEADDQHYLGIDGTLIPWLDNLWSTLLQHFPLAPHQHIIGSEVRPPPRITFTPVAGPASAAKDAPPTPKGMVEATLARNERVTAQVHFQDTRQIALQYDHDLDYQAGDILEIRPENSPVEVDEFLRMMKWEDQANQTYEVKSRTKERALANHWPRHATLRQLFISYLDIFSIPRRSFFEWLSYFTESELETEKLREFCTAEGQEDMYDYANRPRRTIAEVLAEFRSAKIPLEYITDIFPEIRPRQFSIASSSKVNNRRVELLVAIVKYKTMLAKPRKGVATSYLADLAPGSKLLTAFVAGTMRLPNESPERPIILIGPGTGIAPFRAFVQERLALDPSHTESLVFFGCRSRHKDHYFAEEWEQLQQQDKVRFVVAASRDQEDKVYVQHKITEEAEKVWEYIGQRNGIVYVSGSSGSMPKAVQKALKAVFRDQSGMTEDEADSYFERLEAEGRYQEETWS